MTPKATAAIGLRIIGIWLLFEAAFSAFNAFGLHQAAMSGQPGIHRRFYNGDINSATAAEPSLHDTYYIVSDSTLHLVGGTLRLVGGLILIFASKPLARLVARKLDTF